MRELIEILKSFLKIGAFTFGGGYAMIPIIQYEVVNRRGWLSEKEFVELLTIAQAAPGPITLNTAVFVGYKCKGYKGAVAAIMGVVIPSFVIILLVAIFFTSFKDNPYVIKAFKGIRPVVVALIGVPMIDMFKATKMRWWSWLVWISSMVLVCLLSVSPIYILICVIAVAAFISWYNNRKAV